MKTSDRIRFYSSLVGLAGEEGEWLREVSTVVVLVKYRVGLSDESKESLVKYQEKYYYYVNSIKKIT